MNHRYSISRRIQRKYRTIYWQPGDCLPINSRTGSRSQGGCALTCTEREAILRLPPPKISASMRDGKTKFLEWLTTVEIDLLWKFQDIGSISSSIQAFLSSALCLKSFFKQQMPVDKSGTSLNIDGKTQGHERSNHQVTSHDLRQC